MNDKLTPIQEKAWQLYCEETAGSMDVRDYWHQLPEYVQQIYIEKAQLAELASNKVKVGDIVEVAFAQQPQIVVGIVSHDRIDVRDLGVGKGSIGIPADRVKHNYGPVERWHALSLCAGWTLAMSDGTPEGQTRRKVALRAMEFLHAKFGDAFHNKLMVEKGALPEE